MDIVLLFNGLGNQMSQYAFYLAKKQTGRRTKSLAYIDKYIDQHNGFELEKVFGIKPDYRSTSFIGKLWSVFQYSESFIGKKRRVVEKIFKICGIKKIRESITDDYNVLNLVGYQSTITYYWGGWHSEKYFSNIRDLLLKLFQFDESRIDGECLDILHKIENTNSVSVHVRRGDFVNHPMFDGICTEKYYNKAKEYIEKYVEDPYYFVFSDDIRWVNEHFNFKNIIIVDCNKGKDSWRDMYLMSRCKYNINANSTFSWWGAWLNQNPRKIVVVPERFCNNGPTPDFYPETWHKL